MKLLRFLLISMLAVIGAKSAYAQFADTTDGTTQETEGGFTPQQFEEMKNSPDPQVRQFYKNLTEGRFSSSKKGDSRFSSHLEMHDFDLDQVTDHGDADNDLEGASENAALGTTKGMDAGPKRDNALEEARKKKERGGGTCIVNASNKDAVTGCKNISAVLVDLGSAHAGKDDPGEDHRVYGVDKKTKDEAEKAGQSYFAAFKADVLAMKGADGKQTRDYGNDEIRSEAVWLYKQWQFKMETAWKTLRAARLAGFFTNNPNDPSYPQGMAFMREVGNKISGHTDQSNTDQQIAEDVYLRSPALEVAFCRPTTAAGAWALCPEKIPPPPAAQPEQASLGRLLNGAPAKGQPAISDQQKTQLYEQAIAQARVDASKDKDAQSKIAQIKQCMSPEVWCYTPYNAILDKNRIYNDPPDNKPLGIKAYTPAQGDPGNVFWDTREPLFIKMSEASKLPLAKQKAYVDGSIDFAPKMSGGRDNPNYKEWTDYLNGMLKNVEQIRQMGKENREALNKSGGQGTTEIEDTFDPNKKTILQMFGNNSVNETYSAGYGFGGSPAPAPASVPPSKQTLPGTDLK